MMALRINRGLNIQACCSLRSRRLWAFGALVLPVLYLAFSWHNREPSAAEIEAEVKPLGIAVEIGAPICPWWLYERLPGPLQRWAERRKHVTALFAGGRGVTDSQLTRWS